jgi:hypothetical protein
MIIETDHEKIQCACDHRWRRIDGCGALTVLMPEWDDRQRQRALQAFTEGHIAAAIRSTTGWHREESSWYP